MILLSVECAMILKSMDESNITFFSFSNIFIYNFDIVIMMMLICVLGVIGKLINKPSMVQLQHCNYSLNYI